MKVAIDARIDPKTYVPHALHTGERAWAETNCYVDLWIETLHGLGYEPLACLPFTVGLDFEGDQFTFFKFPLADLYDLYGIEVIELNVWNKMLGHVTEQLGLGRPFIVEIDAWYLPDTAGSSYRTEHVKTSISIQSIDLEAQVLGYWHAQSYYELSGEDFIGIFRQTPELKNPNILAPYTEIAKLGAREPLRGDALVRTSVELLRKHVARRPKANPFAKFKERFAADLPALTNGGDVTFFHGYAFATLRQAGACFEVAAAYMRWLEKNGHAGLEEVAARFTALSEGAKSLQFKLARAVRLKKPVDLATIDEMASTWEAAMLALETRFGGGKA
jgi:hypothetical protein